MKNNFLSLLIIFILVLELSFVSADICYGTGTDNANNTRDKIDGGDDDLVYIGIADAKTKRFK